MNSITGEADAWIGIHAWALYITQVRWMHFESGDHSTILFVRNLHIQYWIYVFKSIITLHNVIYFVL